MSIRHWRQHRPFRSYLAVLTISRVPLLLLVGSVSETQGDETSRENGFVWQWNDSFTFSCEERKVNWMPQLPPDTKYFSLIVWFGMIPKYALPLSSLGTVTAIEPQILYRVSPHAWHSFQPIEGATAPLHQTTFL